MIIDDLNVLSARIGPSKTHPKLIADPNAVLSFPVAFKGFQTIPGWYAKVLQPPRDFTTGRNKETLNSGNRVGSPAALSSRTLNADRDRKTADYRIGRVGEAEHGPAIEELINWM